MKIFSKLVQTLKGSGPEPSTVPTQICVGGSISDIVTVRFACEPTAVASQTCLPIVTREDFEFLRTLRMLQRSGPTHSYGLKIFQGRLSFDGRVVCGRCVSRRCFDSSRLVVAKKDVSLFGCDGCRDFLIRVSGPVY